MALLSVADALARVIEGVTPLPAEEVPLAEAEGRVLAEDLAARRTQPPHDVSAMDGYAVRAADVAVAPATLTLVGEVAAGRPFTGRIEPGETARIAGIMAAKKTHELIPLCHPLALTRSRSTSRPTRSCPA